MYSNIFKTYQRINCKEYIYVDICNFCKLYQDVSILEFNISIVMWMCTSCLLYTYIIYTKKNNIYRLWWPFSYNTEKYIRKIRNIKYYCFHSQSLYIWHFIAATLKSVIFLDIYYECFLQPDNQTFRRIRIIIFSKIITIYNTTAMK